MYLFIFEDYPFPHFFPSPLSQLQQELFQMQDVVNLAGRRGRRKEELRSFSYLFSTKNVSFLPISFTLMHICDARYRFYVFCFQFSHKLNDSDIFPFRRYC